MYSKKKKNYNKNNTASLVYVKYFPEDIVNQEKKLLYVNDSIVML